MARATSLKESAEGHNSNWPVRVGPIVEANRSTLEQTTVPRWCMDRIAAREASGLRCLTTIAQRVALVQFSAEILHELD